MAREETGPSGVLVVDKPQGLTSHDVVNVVRRLIRTRRVGHAGTLDPMATGVHVLLVGAATRLSRFAMDADKRYRGVVRMGETTTTYDAEGETVAGAPVDVDRATIEAVLPSFTGEILQTPPMYAAIKVEGRKLYELAREGKEVRREPRSVTIHSLQILAWDPPDLTLDVVCSSGTYIRSLAHDIGATLGCGAHLHALTRLRSGPFTVDSAYSLRELETLQLAGALPRALLPPQAALASMPAVVLSGEQVQAVRYGQTIDVALEGQPEPVQARDTDGELVAVLIGVGESGYRPIMVLPASSTA